MLRSIISVHYIEGTWGKWGNWSVCTKTCGGGTRSRTRKCVKKCKKGKDCVGLSEQSEHCNTKCCGGGMYNYVVSMTAQLITNYYL